MNFSNTLWISHSAISSFERCPHLYYFEYEYRNPKTNNRIQIINPYLALGSAVHETIEGLLGVSPKERVKISLPERFDEIFNKYRGLSGGFTFKKKEDDFYKRGVEMVKRVEKSSFLEKPSTSLETNFPTVDLLGSDVKLVGSVDWVEILPTGGAHIIDFKTGNSKEKNGSLQLPIYKILAENNLSRKIEKVSYWYLQHDDMPVEERIEDTSISLQMLKDKASKIKTAVEKKNFLCNYPGRCFSCKDYEKIFKGEARLIEPESGGRKKDTFCVFSEKEIVDKVLTDDFLDEREKKIFELRMKLPMEKVEKALRLTEEKGKKIGEVIKVKLKKNLYREELKIIVKKLQK